MARKHDYEVSVGNVGTVYRGHSITKARKTYADYVRASKALAGRAAGEDVFLFKDGDISKEHVGLLSRREALEDW